MPVLPLVGSRIVAPGESCPSFSARRIMLSAARSLIDPVGFWSSSLAHRRTSGVGERLGSPTSGVPPTESIRESKRTLYALEPGDSAAGDRRQDHHGVTVGDRGVEATGEPDVLVVDVDVDEAAGLTVLEQALLDAGVVDRDLVDQLGDGHTAAFDITLAIGVGVQYRGDADLD